MRGVSLIRDARALTRPRRRCRWVVSANPHARPEIGGVVVVGTTRVRPTYRSCCGCGPGPRGAGPRVAESVQHWSWVTVWVGVRPCSKPPIPLYETGVRYLIWPRSLVTDARAAGPR